MEDATGFGAQELAVVVDMAVGSSWSMEHGRVAVDIVIGRGRL
jgi:hypothetical protein